MALKKKVINERGVATNYHRVENVNFDLRTLEANVAVYSYVDSDIREEEKEVVNAVNTYRRGMNKLNEYSEQIRDGKIKEEDIRVEAAEIQHSMNLISEQYPEILATNLSNRQADQKDYRIDFEAGQDLSVAWVYEQLKKLDDFEGAEDV